MTHTPQQRLAIASAFATARARMWDGCPTTRGEQFICIALDSSGPDRPSVASHQAIDIVTERLGVHYTLEGYIDLVVGIPQSERTTQDVQGFRIRWLDSLIQEFSA